MYFKLFTYGNTYIVNAHGSIKEISGDVVIKLKDKFTDYELTEAIYNLYKNNQLRANLSKKSLKYIEEKHHPVKASKEYYHAIENFYSFDNSSFRERYLIQKISAENFYLFSNKNLLSISTAISANRLPLSCPQLLIDISTIKLNNKHPLAYLDLLKGLLSFSVQGYRIEAIYYNNILNKYCYAINLATTLLNLENKLFGDTPIEIFSQDVLLIGVSMYEEIDINNYLKKLNGKRNKDILSNFKCISD